MITINFFGTHNFATTILHTLINSSDIEIKTVFTMPDRPVGRKRELQASPIKLLAKKHNLNIEQPSLLKNYRLKNTNYDLNIVVDYGMFIPQIIIDTPKYGTINVHPSLLPKYRGPSPIQSVLLNGETKTGISLMLIDNKMDHGPILKQNTFTIDKNDTYLTLSTKLSHQATTILIDTIKKYIANEITPQEQNHKNATFCKMLKREDGLINFNQSAQEIYNQYRAFTPWPGIFTYFSHLRLKLLKIIPSKKRIEIGKIVFDNKQIFIGCKNESIEILELQLEGKKAMNAQNFINGNKL